MLDFSTLERSGRPNDALIAPDGLCPRAAPDAPAPAFEAPLEDLKAAFMRMLAGEPRIEMSEESPQALELVQRSRIFRFPDRISVRFIAITDASATLAIYSRAVHGRYDFGVNKKRVERFLAALHQACA